MKRELLTSLFNNQFGASDAGSEVIRRPGSCALSDPPLRSTSEAASERSSYLFPRGAL